MSKYTELLQVLKSVEERTTTLEGIVAGHNNLLANTRTELEETSEKAKANEAAVDFLMEPPLETPEAGEVEREPRPGEVDRNALERHNETLTAELEEARGLLVEVAEYKWAYTTGSETPGTAEMTVEAAEWWAEFSSKADTYLTRTKPKEVPFINHREMQEEASFHATPGEVETALTAMSLAHIREAEAKAKLKEALELLKVIRVTLDSKQSLDWGTSLHQKIKHLTRTKPENITVDGSGPMAGEPGTIRGEFTPAPKEAGGLVEAVAKAVATTGAPNWKIWTSEARAAIAAVADWLEEANKEWQFHGLMGDAIEQLRYQLKAD